jgi:hypothetical protein
MGHAASKEADRNAVGASSGAQIDHAAEAANMVRIASRLPLYDQA